MYRLIISLVTLLLVSTALHAAVQGREVEYKSGDTVLKGYLAYDDKIKDPRPGILVVHEWWGHNDYARNRAKMLAELGYVALALDMYGGGKQAAHPHEAGQFSNEIAQNIELGKARFMAALDLLQKQPQTDSNQIAAIGYCFGGTVVLQMAREGVDLKGVASFHGGLATPRAAQEGKVKAKIAVYVGEKDPFIPPEQILKFKDEMKNAKIDVHFVSYPEAMHSFTNPDADTYGAQFNLPLKYNAEADQESWADMQQFFKTIFSK